MVAWLSAVKRGPTMIPVAVEAVVGFVVSVVIDVSVVGRGVGLEVLVLLKLERRLWMDLGFTTLTGYLIGVSAITQTMNMDGNGNGNGVGLAYRV